jgi:uncharacterized protein involved in type VI secretion and phage assembly
MKYILPSPVRFRCDLPTDDLRFISMNSLEGISTVGRTDVTLASASATIDSSALLGKAASIEIQLDRGARAAYAAAWIAIFRFFRFHLQRGVVP